MFCINWPYYADIDLFIYCFFLTICVIELSKLN